MGAVRLLWCIGLLVTLPAVLSACFDEKKRLHYVKKSFILLKSMGERLPKDCQLEAMRIHISHERQNLLELKKEDTIPTLKQVFNLTGRLFRKLKTAVNWDVSKVDTFRSLLKRQRRNYSTCVKDTMSKSSPQTKNDGKRAYFEKLTGFLSTEKYSRCAWETVRAEILTLLLHVQRIIHRLGDAEAAG